MVDLFPPSLQLQVEERQDNLISQVAGVSPLIIFAAVFGFQVGSLLIGETGRLESDPECGRVTGGAEECYWDCNNEDLLALQIATNFDCIADCIPEQCEIFTNIFTDIRDGGLCEGSLLHQILTFRNIPVKTGPCNFFTGSPFLLTEGTCSILLSTLLEGEEPQQCLSELLTLPPVVLDTIFAFVTSSCTLKLPQLTEDSDMEAACYSTCEFIEINGYQTKIVSNIQCLRSCFENTEILSLYNLIESEGVCENSPVQNLLSSPSDSLTSCTFPDLNFPTEPALAIVSDLLRVLTQLPAALLSCAATILLRGGVLGSITTCSSIFAFNVPTTFQTLPTLLSLPDFVLQSNIFWFISSSLFSSVTSLLYQFQFPSLPAAETEFTFCFTNSSQEEVSFNFTVCGTVIDLQEFTDLGNNTFCYTNSSSVFCEEGELFSSFPDPDVETKLDPTVFVTGYLDNLIACLRKGSE